LPTGNHPINSEWIDLEDETGHLGKHQVNLIEVSQVYKNSPIFIKNMNKYPGTWLMIGRTDGNRAVICSISYDPTSRAVRPRNARFCTDREVEKWGI